MKSLLQHMASTLLLIAAVKAPSQFYRYLPQHGGSISLGATGNFVTPLTRDPRPVTLTNGTNTQTVSNQLQYITSSAGFLTSLQFHPVPWAGVELNYGYQHYSERVNYTVTGTNGITRVASTPTTTHEATAAYQFHPKHIPFQPFVNIGGGAIDFVPTNNGGNQWRGAGLVETGFEIQMPATQRRLALRIQGRGLFYRAPNFSNTALSTRSWRVSSEPSASLVYRF